MGHWPQITDRKTVDVLSASIDSVSERLNDIATTLGEVATALATMSEPSVPGRPVVITHITHVTASPNVLMSDITFDNGSFQIELNDVFLTGFVEASKDLFEYLALTSNYGVNFDIKCSIVRDNDETDESFSGRKIKDVVSKISSIFMLSKTGSERPLVMKNHEPGLSDPDVRLKVADLHELIANPPSWVDTSRIYIALVDPTVRRPVDTVLPSPVARDRVAKRKVPSGEDVDQQQ